MIVYTRHLTGEAQQRLLQLTGKRLSHIRLADAVISEDHTEGSIAFIRLPDRSRLVVRFERMETSDILDFYFNMHIEKYDHTDPGEEEWILKRRRNTVVVDFGYPVLRTIEIFRRHAKILRDGQESPAEAIDYDAGLLFRFADQKGFILECSNTPSASVIFRYLNPGTERELKKRYRLHRMLTQV